MSIKLRDFYETGKRVNGEPLICVFEDFLEESEMEQLLVAAKPKLTQALVTGAKTGVADPERTGSNCWISHRHNEVIGELSLRIAEVVGIPLGNAESFQVVYYQQGEEYAPHFDAWDVGTERGYRCMAMGGQRMVTCLLYLNDVEAGGGTSFPNLDMEIRAKKGRMLIYHNCFEGSTVRHPNSVHGGMPVRRGEKWACNLWFREKSYQVPGTTPERKTEPIPSPQFNHII